MPRIYACKCGSRVFTSVRLMTLSAEHEIPVLRGSPCVEDVWVAGLCISCGEIAKPGVDVVTMPESEDPFRAVFDSP